jgi:non-ribosomal peptide synthetase component E (peptide arylation enzyme)
MLALVHLDNAMDFAFCFSSSFKKRKGLQDPVSALTGGVRYEAKQTCEVSCNAAFFAHGQDQGHDHRR